MYIYVQRVKLLYLTIAVVATVPRPLVAKRLQTFPLLLILSPPFLQNAWSLSPPWLMAGANPMQVGHNVVDKFALVCLKLK